MQLIYGKRPSHFFTKNEAESFNIEIKKERKPDAIWEKETGEIVNLYNLQKETKGIKILPFKNYEIGFFDKKVCSKKLEEVKEGEKPFYLLYKGNEDTYVGVYDRRTETNEIFIKNNLCKTKITMGNFKKYKLFTKETLPKEFVLKNKTNGYYLKPEKSEAVGLYLSEKRFYSPVYNISKELSKRHFSKQPIQLGFLTKKNAYENGIEIFDDIPCAYLKSYKETVIPLYDLREHPKLKLKILLKQLK